MCMVYNIWNSLTPSAMRKCSPRFSVLSRTKFLKAVMFSGRVMSPSPSTPPSPGTHRGHVFRESFIIRPPPESCVQVCVCTIIRLKQLAWCGIKILQFEVTGSFQRHAKSFGMPTPPPQDVLWKASWSCTDVTKVEKLAVTIPCQRFLHNESLLLAPSVYMSLCIVYQQNLKKLTPCESFGLVNMLSKQWSMFAIFIAALKTGKTTMFEFLNFSFSMTLIEAQFLNKCITGTIHTVFSKVKKRRKRKIRSFFKCVILVKVYKTW